MSSKSGKFRQNSSTCKIHSAAFSRCRQHFENKFRFMSCIIEYIYRAFLCIPDPNGFCRSLRSSNEHLVAKIGSDIAENEPCEVCPLSACHSLQVDPSSEGYGQGSSRSATQRGRFGHGGRNNRRTLPNGTSKSRRRRTRSQSWRSTLSRLAGELGRVKFRLLTNVAQIIIILAL